jgi:hypothetical protein
MVEALSIIAAIAMAVGTGSLLLLRVVPTGYNPLHDAVSDYAIGRYRALFWTFAIAGAVSGLALALALARSHPSKPALTIAMLVLSAAARVLVPLFPTDQSGSRFQTPTGTIHMVLAVVVFASIAVAASDLGETLGHEPAWHAVHGLVAGWLPWVITITATVTGVSIVGPRLKRIFGLIERSYYLFSIIWFFVVSIELARISS